MVIVIILIIIIIIVYLINILTTIHFEPECSIKSIETIKIQQKMELYCIKRSWKQPSEQYKYRKSTKFTVK